jgi:hypothetical protein
MSIVTKDLSGFGYRELDMAADLLIAYADCGSDFLGDGVTLNFNPYSGEVFLSDDEYHVGMIDDNDKLREWHYCPYCGKEGFDGDEHYSGICLEFSKYDGYCSEECRSKELG